MLTFNPDPKEQGRIASGGERVSLQGGLVHDLLSGGGAGSEGGSVTLAIHSEVKDVTGGQRVVHVQSKEPGGEPSATAPHARWASDSQSIMLGLGRKQVGTSVSGTSDWVAWGVRPQPPRCSH